MNKEKKELLNARREANQEKKQVKIQQEIPPVDNRVRFVTYINRDGEEITRYCQDFKIVGNDAYACGIMWMGDSVENQPGHREVIGQTFGIKEWGLEKLEQTWEEYSKNKE
ncbi:hypothetical protein KAR91_49260 [Candidatus Pacearchaeota archaeon]|nr:hypothetical protein [Candidatus Pacearchaeota archaeon]